MYVIVSFIYTKSLNIYKTVTMLSVSGEDGTAEIEVCKLVSPYVLSLNTYD